MPVSKHTSIPSGQASPALRTAVERGEAADALKGWRTSIAGFREQRRDKVCVGAKHPGKPSDYAYRISEACTPKDPSKRRRRAAARSGVSLSDTKKEIRLLEQQLATMPRSTDDVSVAVLQACNNVFRSMIRTDMRTRFPDPEQRWLAIMGAIAKRIQAKKIQERVVYDVLKPAIFALVLTHLTELVHPSSGRTRAAQAPPPSVTPSMRRVKSADRNK